MPSAKKAPPKKKIEFEQSDSSPVFYVNSTGVRITQWDFLFQLGTISEVTDAGVKVKENLRVYMSPQHTKAFLDLLSRQVRVYEEKFHAIPDPMKAPDETETTVSTKR
jgi:hypothetical protein